MELGAIGFVRLARAITDAGRASGAVVPAFRSPPRIPGAVRTIRIMPSGPVVSVAIKGRSEAEVAKDMIAGVLRVNAISGDAARRLSRLLHESVLAEVMPKVPPASAA